MTKDEALRLALEALEKTQSALARCMGPHKSEEGDRHRALAHSRTTITAIKAALEAKDEPVAWAEQKLSEPCQCGKQTMAWCMANTCGKAEQKPVVWGASSISKPEYIAEQKAKTKELRNMMDEFVQTIPNFDQLQQIVNNLERCLTRDSKHEFLRVWIRDWTEHKLSKHTPPPVAEPHKRPSRSDIKPLTDEQAMDAYFETPPFGTYKEAFIAGIRFIEAAHGIKGEA